MDFLRAMTGENISTIKYRTESFPAVPDTVVEGTTRKKQTFLDFFCTDQKGRRFIMEVQVKHENCFDERAFYYAAGTYASQLKDGDPWFKLKPVMALQILDHQNIRKKDAPRPKGDFERRYRIIDDLHLNNIKTISSIVMWQIELPRVDFSALPVGIPPEKVAWLKFFKDASRQQEIPRDASPVIRKAYERLRIRDWTDAMRREYEAMDVIDVTRYTEVLGQAEERGIEKGIAIGVKEGVAIGVKEDVEKVALSMLAKGMAVEFVADVTGLGIEQINALWHVQSTEDQPEH